MIKKAVAVVLVLAVLAGFGLALLFTSLFGAGIASVPQTTACQTPASVTVTSDQLDAVQLSNAAAVISAGETIPGVGTEGEVVAVATALVESTLHNYANPTVPATETVPNDGDPPGGPNLDSAGLFQQRSSQGWGTPQQEMDPAQSAEMFYRHLLALPQWETVDADTSAADLGAIAQAVQQSAFPDRYAAEVPEATSIVSGAVTATSSDPTLASCTTGTSGVVIPLPDVGLPASVVAGIGEAPLQVQEAIAYALSKLGDAYVWGATGPDTFDCSGLVQAAYGAAGVSLSRTTYTQVAEGTPVDQAALEPGDLVFPDAGHVQIYLGDNLIVEAPETGLTVRVVPMWGFWQARRIVQPTAVTAGVAGPAGVSTPLSCPAGSEIVAPGDVPGIAPGRNYCFEGGTYSGFSVAPQTGDRFLGGGHAILQGDGQQSAFASSGPVSNMTIDGFTITGYYSASNFQTPGAIWLRGGSNDTISNNTLTGDRLSAIETYGSGALGDYTSGVDNSLITHNTLSNIGYSGITVSNGTGDTVSYNDVSSVDTDGSDHEDDVASVGKFAVDNNTKVIGNYIHNSPAHGIWFDVFDTNNLVQGNRLIDINVSCIFIEEAGTTLVENNLAEGCGAEDAHAPGNPGAGISVSSSGPVTVTGNTLSDNEYPGVAQFVGHPGLGVDVIQSNNGP